MEELTCLRSYKYEVAKPGFRQAEWLPVAYLQVFSQEDNSIKQKQQMLWMMKMQLDYLWLLKLHIFEISVSKFGGHLFKMTNNNNNINDS